MLTIGDNELAVRDNNDALLEVAKGEAYVRVPGNLREWATCDLAS